MSDITQDNSSTPGLVKCDHAEVCDREDKGCLHSLPHQHRFSCNSHCLASSFKQAHCIPVEPEMVVAEPSKHEALWLRLRCELQTMQTNGARHLDPVFLMRFMDYLETVEEPK